MIKANTGLDIEVILGAGGVISQSFGGFERRAEQVEMARAVQRRLRTGDIWPSRRGQAWVRALHILYRL